MNSAISTVWDDILSHLTRETETARQVRVIAEGLAACDYGDDLLRPQALTKKP